MPRSGIAAAAAVLSLAAGCRAPQSTRTAEHERPRPLFVYLVNCDSSVGRLELASASAATVVMLAARTTAWLIPQAHEDSCSVYSPRFEARNNRLFVVSPQEEGRGTRLWRILGFRVPDFAFTDAIELEQPSPFPPAILPSADALRLLVSIRVGPNASEVIAYQIERPRGARLLEETLEDASFGDQAYLGPDGATIYDREQRVGPDGSVSEYALDNLLGTPEGAGLEPLAAGRGAHKSVPAFYADSAAARILYRVHAKTASLPVLLDTQTDRVVLFESAPPAGLDNLHLTPDGKRVLVEEVDQPEAASPARTGRIAVFDAESGALTANWRIPQIAGAGSKLACISPRGELLYAAQGRLLEFDSIRGVAAMRDPGLPLDRLSRCFFADR